MQFKMNAIWRAFIESLLARKSFTCIAPNAKLPKLSAMAPSSN